MNSRIQFIEGQLKLANADLAEAESERDAASLKLIELDRAAAGAAQPDATKVRNLHQARAELEVLEAEVQEHLKKIKRLELATTAAAKEDTREFKLAVRVRVGELQTKIDDRMQRMEELESEVLSVLQAIAPKLGELNRLGDQNHQDAWAIAKAAVGMKEAPKHMDLISDVVRGASMAPSLALGLYGSCLLGHLRHYVDIRYMPTTASSFAYDRRRATDALAGLVARYDAELAGKKPAAPKAITSGRGADLAGMAELRAKGEA